MSKLVNFSTKKEVKKLTVKQKTAVLGGGGTNPSHHGNQPFSIKSWKGKGG